jgi:hypothetical protein
MGRDILREPGAGYAETKHTFRSACIQKVQVSQLNAQGNRI